MNARGLLCVVAAGLLVSAGGVCAQDASESKPVVAERTASGGIVVPMNARAGTNWEAMEQAWAAQQQAAGAAMESGDQGTGWEEPQTVYSYDALMHSYDHGYSISTLHGGGAWGLGGWSAGTWMPAYRPGHGGRVLRTYPANNVTAGIGDPGFDPFNTGFARAQLRFAEAASAGSTARADAGFARAQARFSAAASAGSTARADAGFRRAQLQFYRASVSPSVNGPGAGVIEVPASSRPRPTPYVAPRATERPARVQAKPTVTSSRATRTDASVPQKAPNSAARPTVVGGGSVPEKPRR